MAPVHTGASSAAPALRFDEQPEAVRAPAAVSEKPAEPAPRARAYQRSLFPSKEMPQVVPFESIAPWVTEPRASKGPATHRPRAKKPIPGQQDLDFTAAVSPARRVNDESHPLIYCDAPVAVLAHRVMAAAIDTSLVVIALGLFMLVFRSFLFIQGLNGSAIPVNKQTLVLFLGIAAVLGLLYKILWCLANGDTAGMRWSRLRVVTFDGRNLDREQRLVRLASGCLSFLAAGLGLAWALVDEETLTWHDHISKTFPTPY
jgi:uncharacterized RDD family membrane protein YckC